MADGQLSNSISLSGHGGTSICKSDVGAGGEEVVATFDGIATHTPSPRGRCNIKLHLSFLLIRANNNDFEIPYTSVSRVFWLPEPNQHLTFVVLTLDPPIRKDQSLYPHFVLQFDTDDVIETTLSISEDLYNSRYKDKLQLVHKGLIHDIFVTILSGLSGAKVTKLGWNRSWQIGLAVNSLLESEEGFLYPLEDSLFFLPNPPTLILYEEIAFVEFERHIAGSLHYFDFFIRLKTEQEHVFQNIPRKYFHPLFVFANKKRLKIMNLGGPYCVTEGNNRNPPMDPYNAEILNAAFEDESGDEDYSGDESSDEQMEFI